MPGLLLHGRPGAGKTMLARSLAGTTGLPLVASSVGYWFASGKDAHLGSVIAAARTFFDLATASAPCVALLDELDSLPDRARLDGRARDSMAARGNGGRR